MLKRTFLFFLVPLFLTITAACYAQEFTAKVTRVIDGDTIVILKNNEQTKIRLAEIDTPERKQPWYRNSKKALSDLIFQKNITVVPLKKDHYGRLIANIFLDGNNINHKMVENGDAWVYRKYSDDQQLLDLEEQARSEKIGIWSLPENEKIPPWEWRSNRKK